MHVFIENARKAAGISGMTKNYPDDPKQRGCGYWAAFLGSINNDCGKRDAEILAAERQHSAELKQAHKRIEDLELELRMAREAGVKKGVQLLQYKEGWSIEKGREAEKTVAG